ncbi:MAG: sulfurtransferase [Elusimicrobia bacterium]|nr:sulfurtransferase [Elusimicrobiota bacterium]
MDPRRPLSWLGPAGVPLAFAAFLLASPFLKVPEPSPPPAAKGSRFEALVAQARARVRATTVRALRARREGGAPDFYLIDVREDREWAAGRLPGAIHLSKGVLERDIEKTVPDPDAEIVVYCGTGGRSALAAESLSRMGYTRVFNLEGGARAWYAEGEPVAVK